MSDELVGTVRADIVNRGSKGEMTAVVLDTDDEDRPVVLRRRDAQALSAAPELLGWVGQRVRVAGSRSWTTFVVDHIEPLDEITPDEATP